MGQVARTARIYVRSGRLWNLRWHDLGLDSDATPYLDLTLRKPNVLDRSLTNYLYF